MSLVDNALFLAGSSLVVGAIVGYWLVRWKERGIRAALRIKEQSILETAAREAETLAREARLKASEEAAKLKQETEHSFAARQAQLLDAEKRLVERETLINKQLEHLVADEKAQRDQQLDWQKKCAALDAQRCELGGLMKERRDELKSIGRLSEAEARSLLMKEIEMEALQDAADLTRRIIDEAKNRAEEKARRIISLAIQRYAGEHTFESTSATLTLPDEELKGRIIGREGRNIRAFENATGVTVLIDDTPNAVVLSGFDPVRREIARESMQRLLLDGRIHPTRIEEIVAKVSAEMDETIARAGEDAVRQAGLPAMHPEIGKLLGRLHFRHSFSQNILQHSVEVAHLTGLLAAELGLEVATAKRAGLLHDIGKAINHEVEGAHALIGADLIRRHGESEEVVNAVASHHDEVPHHGPLGILVGAADAISASRPGARSETMTTYIKRVEDLEKIGCSFAGVERCFAVQAGRELRVMVQPEKITDEQAFALARSISRKVEEELQYPGQIRVTVVRETRCVEYAK
ncbi:MAG: ribonuclease Y [Verrucomicrobia subdivision 3 bacterium]|nr:ribonuclease Y [Limisphaerales bacterium]